MKKIVENSQKSNDSVAKNNSIIVLNNSALTTIKGGDQQRVGFIGDDDLISVLS
jgi:hypothetical protein